MEIISVNWSELKTCADSMQINIRYLDIGSTYHIRASDGLFAMSCEIKKDGNSDQTDFETNYKADANQPVNDIDGALIVRNKSAMKGATFDAVPLEFKTSKLNSTYSKDYDNVARTTVSLKLYDVNDDEITLVANEGNAVKTVIDLELPYDFEVIGGTLFQYAAPANDVRIWVVVVPDLTPAQGGSKEMVGGINLKFFKTGMKLDADGRASKFLTFNNTSHTNKFRFIVRHPAGENHEIMAILEMYK
jgi:hypothetical protein